MPYNISVRKFSLVLSVKSKSAYKWMRKSFSNRLPAVRTIRRWQSNSRTNFPPGFNDQTIQTLTELTEKQRDKGKELYVSLCHDEVAIRRHVQWIHMKKYFSGIVSHARRNDDEKPIANNAIFFLITLVETGRSLILGYFLIKSLNADEKTQLLKDAIQKIHITGAHLMSISFDGLSSNLAACEQLGASFDVANLRPFILNTEYKRNIYIVFDPPHMLKLVRNCLHAKRHLKDGNNNEISWDYFENLVSQKNDLVSHKMTKNHIDFQSDKMNVKLAAQTLSFSVANSMEMLLQHGDPFFHNAAGTITFVKNFNKAFDIFNSKHLDSNNLFKRGLNEQTAERIFQFLDYFDKYLKSIKLNGINILKTSRRTGFLGFLINIATLRFFHIEYTATQKIENILFYNFGQDMLESLFSRIRSMLGNNNNPTAEQLSGVLRQLVILNEITASEKANCEDNLDVLTTSSTRIPSVHVVIHSVNDQNQNEEHEPIPDMNLNFKDIYTIKIRAGTIEKKIRYGKPQCSHFECINIFKRNDDKIDGIFYETGFIQRPTKSTSKICEIVYKFFSAQCDIYNFDFITFYNHILNAIPFDELYLHIDFTHNMEHKSQFILLIIDEYIRLHATYLARITTLELHTKLIGKVVQKLKHHLGQ